MLATELKQLWHLYHIFCVSGLAAEPDFSRFRCRGVRGATRGPNGQGAPFQACSCQPGSWLLGNVLMTMTRPWVYQQKAPRPGIEPGSSAWMAEILTTILPRICCFWQFLLKIKLDLLRRFHRIFYVSGLAAELDFSRFWFRGLLGATRGPNGQGASFQACSFQPGSWLLGIA